MIRSPIKLIKKRSPHRRSVYGMITAVLTAGLALTLTQSASVHATDNTTLQEDFTSAAKEFKVPEKVLISIAYNQSHWRSHGKAPSSDGGYGLTDLRSSHKNRANARGDNKEETQQPKSDPDIDTLDKASELTGQSTETLKTDNKQNIRGAAAVLEIYAKEINNGNAPDDMNKWYAVVAKFSGFIDAQTASEFADDVYNAIKNGIPKITVDGQVMELPADPNVNPDRNSVPHHNRPSPSETECPRSIDCRFVPAAYTQNDPNNVEDWGSYSKLNEKRKVTQIVIHDTEGSYQSAIDHFQDPTAYVSSHYVIRSSDGQVTQMVKDNDVAWGAGNWYTNGNSINIEHEGFAAQGATWYTDAMYRSSAKLVRYLAQKYDIPLDRQHIIGHDNVPSLSTGGLTNQHWDPGPFWDWSYYMSLLNDGDDNSSHHSVSDRSKAVTITPKFDKNQQDTTDCTTTPGTCVSLPTQSTNQVYLRTEPRDDAPLLSDPYKHTDNKPGTNAIDDWSATATYGQQYALAEKRGDWTGVWFGGQVGWFYNPDGWKQTAHGARRVTTVTPKSGKTTIPVYGAAYPETSAYPQGVQPQTLTQLYTIPAGQVYVAVDDMPTNYLYSWTINSSVPNDNVFIKGNDKFYQIDYNHRVFYVRASDVDRQ